MEINRAAFGALAVFGVVAAGGGAYLANRHNEVAMQPVTTYPAATTSAVTETENSITTAPAAAVETAPVVAADPAPAPPRPARVARPGACAHGTSSIAARAVVVEFRRQRGFSGADVHTVGHRGGVTGVGGSRAAGKHDRRTRGRRPGTSAEAV